MAHPSTSLLVTTYNRPRHLELVLRSIFHQSVLPDEIIVADDGSGEETSALIASLKSISPVPLYHVWQEDRGFRKTAILNKGIVRATSDYIIQIDDDCILHKHFVKDHLRFVQEGRFVAGTRVDLTEKNTEQTLKTGQLKLSHDPAQLSLKALSSFKMLRCPTLTQWHHKRKGTKGAITDKVAGHNFAFWKHDAVAINGYDETYEGWGLKIMTL